MKIGILGSGVARHTEPFGILIGELACSGDRSPALAYRFDAFAEPGASV